MNKILAGLKKNWTRIWFISVLLLSTASYVTYAVYKEVSSVKRVVSTTSAPGELFSSNCMRKDISSRALSSTNTFEITVCNYDQEKSLSYNPSQITYALFAELQVKYSDGEYYNMNGLKEKIDEKYADDEEKTEEEKEAAAAAEYAEYTSKVNNQYFIRKSEDDGTGVLSGGEMYFTSSANAENNYIVSFSGETLAAGVSSTDRYIVSVSSSDLEKDQPDFYVRVWAEPNTPLSKIYTRIFGAKSSEASSSWIGSLVESNCASVDYDFYNYVISGSGAGKVDILWDSDVFEINPFFFSDLSGNSFDNSTPVSIAGTAYAITDGTPEAVTAYNNRWKMVTLQVDSLNKINGKDIKNRYELQLYKKDPARHLTGDSKASDFIRCEYRVS